MMRDAILAFADQFAYVPALTGVLAGRAKRVVVLGMGGSHLAADMLKSWHPELRVQVHSDYGLPQILAEELQQSLIVASSYSGNTEEVLSGFDEALARGLNVAAIAVGGELIKKAKVAHVPYVQLPNTGIQPRSALGFSLRALLKVMGENGLLAETEYLAGNLKPVELEARGKALAQKCKDLVPVIYSSACNRAVAYNWKIKLNETGKVPAFYNVLPELNHNEMTSFDVVKTTRGLSEKFIFLVLKDSTDNASLQKRMGILIRLYRERGLKVEEVEISGHNRIHALFSSLVLADWLALHTAEIYGVEATEVPMVEEFKRLMACL